MFTDDLPNVFEHYLLEECVVQRGQRIIIGVSGGADSILLLHLFAEVRERLDLDLVVVTVDHGLRPEVKEEIELVKKTATSLAVRCYVKKINTLKRSQSDRLCLEEAARLERRSALEMVAREISAQCIALGHTQTDQAETVLLRLRRGTGLDGLGCMTPRSGLYIRPMLLLTRARVRSTLTALGICWCEDPMNDDYRFDRSRLRFEVIPQLSDRTAMIVASAASQLRCRLERLEDAWFDAYCVDHGDSVHIDDRGLEKRPTPIAARLLRRAVRPLWSDRLPLRRDETHRLVRLSRGEAGHMTHLHQARARLISGKPTGLIVESRPQSPNLTSVVVNGPGRYRLEGLKMTVVAGGETPCSPLWGVLKDPLPVEIRARLPGDRLALTSEKMKRYWVRTGLWSHLRDWVPLVIRDNMVIWTALTPPQSGDGLLLSFSLDRGHPVRQWVQKMRESGLAQ